MQHESRALIQYFHSGTVLYLTLTLTYLNSIKSILIGYLLHAFRNILAKLGLVTKMDDCDL